MVVCFRAFSSRLTEKVFVESILPCFIFRSLKSIPVRMRFGMSGIICNIMQTVIYSTAVQKLDGVAEPARIYSVLYMFMMFVGHGMGALLVFGWPERYWPSFLSNAPIGVIGMLIGTSLTVFLTWIQYDEMIINLIKTYVPIMPGRSVFVAAGHGCHQHMDFCSRQLCQQTAIQREGALEGKTDERKCFHFYVLRYIYLTHF